MKYLKYLIITSFILIVTTGASSNTINSNITNFTVNDNIVEVSGTAFINGSAYAKPDSYKTTLSVVDSSGKTVLSTTAKQVYGETTTKDYGSKKDISYANFVATFDASKVNLAPGTYDIVVSVGKYSETLYSTSKDLSHSKEYNNNNYTVGVQGNRCYLEVTSLETDLRTELKGFTLTKDSLAIDGVGFINNIPYDNADSMKTELQFVDSKGNVVYTSSLEQSYSPVYMLLYSRSGQYPYGYFTGSKIDLSNLSKGTYSLNIRITTPNDFSTSEQLYTNKSVESEAGNYHLFTKNNQVYITVQ